MQDYEDDELAQIGAGADATFIMAMGGMNKPKPCSAAGNLNSPIINVINRRTRVVHSHRFPKEEPSKDYLKFKLRSAQSSIKKVSKLIGKDKLAEWMKA